MLIGGLILFAIAFALNSAVHSYLILAYSEHDKVAMNVGFYYMSNAAGRLAGKELLKFNNEETTIAQLKDRIVKTIDYLKSFKQSEIDGTEGKDITISFPSGQTLFSE